MKRVILTRSIGFFLVVVASVSFTFRKSITGAVIGTNYTGVVNLISIAMLIVGIVLMSSKDRNYAQEIIDKGAYMDDTNGLRKIARRMGYDLQEAKREGTRVYSGKAVVTVIPRHRKIQGRGTQKSILEALATGESSFRKRTA